MPQTNGWDFEPNNMSNFHNKGNRMGGGGLQGIYDQSAVANYPLGYRQEFDDGRRFRYGYFAAAVNRGLLVGSDVSANCVVEVDNKLTAAAIGATSVIITDAGTLSAATADQYAGGYLVLTDDTGEGYQFRIRTHGAASSNAITLKLYDPLLVAVDTTTDAAIVGCEFDELIVASAATDAVASGVTVRNMTAAYYGWVQVAGIATILADGTIAHGQPLQLSDGVDGAVQAMGGGGTNATDMNTEQFIGTARFAPDDTGHVAAKLNIE
jgi:hypothetical protein